MSKDWLENLAVGDKVIVYRRRNRAVRTVDRLTKTQIIISGSDVRYKRSSGSRVGGSTWDINHIAEATPQLIVEVSLKNKHDRLSSRLESIKWRNMELADLIRVCEALRDEE